MDFIWLIPLIPGIGAALNGLVGVRAFSKRTAGLVATGAMAAAFLLSVVAFVQLLGSAERYHKVTVASWIPPIPLETANGIGSFEVPWAFTLDPLSGMMLLVVTGIGLLIHIYSIGYIDHEPRGGVARFFCYLNLFCFFMLILVLGSSFLVMFVGWEGVGLCSYLLIGYWYKKKSASDAGKKAFIVNRVGDWGFILGIFLVFFTFGTLDFREVAVAAAALPVETAAVGFGVISLICLLLFIGATGKSAQIPLYVWLPDAMEGPTPVSALIHAATMVTAGVYMVCRNAVLFTHAPMVMEVVAAIGVVTALMAATIGLVQTDIKRVLAYSTVSQLGYMFLATGVGAFAAAAFHLMTHAFFKALLFLGSGSVIHAMNEEQDMRRMGGLRRHMPLTFYTMCIGAVAIAGIPPLSGFFSKDEILYRTLPAQPAAVGRGRNHRRDDRVLHVPAHQHDVLRRVPRPGARRGRSRRRSRACLARAARVAAADDLAARGAGGRRGVRGFRRRAGGARRQQHDRALPGAQLHGARRRARRRGGAPLRGGVGVDGAVGAAGAGRHLVRVSQLRAAARKRPMSSQRGSRARTGCSPTSTTSTSCTTRPSCAARCRARPASGASTAGSWTAR